MNDSKDTKKKKSKGQGFASMPKSEVQRIGRKGGLASHRNDPVVSTTNRDNNEMRSSSDIWSEDEDL
jgi:general stress protein YciG